MMPEPFELIDKPVCAAVGNAHAIICCSKVKKTIFFLIIIFFSITFSHIIVLVTILKIN